MSLFNAFTSLASQFTGHQEGQPSPEQHVSATQALLQHFSSQPEGLTGLLNQFRQNNMGQHVDSWLSPQANQPLQPGQVEQALGPQQLTAVAQHAGLSSELTKMALATALPLLISHMSRGSGQLPAHASSGTGLSGLAQSLFSGAL